MRQDRHLRTVRLVVPALILGLVLVGATAPAAAADLYQAVLAGDIERVRSLVAQKADLAEPGDLGTPLHAAAVKGDAAIAALLLDGGADPKTTDELTGRQPLHLAAASGKDEVVELLIARGADLEARELKGRTPLILAAIGSHAGVAELLLAGGADPDASEPFDGTTALHNAAFNGRLGVIERLLAHGAAVDPLSSDGGTPLQWAVGNGQVEVIRLLAARGADVNHRDSAGRSALLGARSAANPDAIIAVLRELGATD